MIGLNRRHLVAGVSAGVLAPLAAALPARAAAPLTGKQAPGSYRSRLGAFEVTVVTDGLVRMPLADNFVVNVKKDEVAAALAAARLPKDTMFNPYNPVVINTGQKLVLIDTGNGEAAAVASKGMSGQLLANMAAAGIDPAAIDAVIVTHFHGDHINGLLKADNTPAFPNAEVLVPAREQAYWGDDAEMSRATGRAEGAFKNVRRVFAGEIKKRLRTYEWGKEVVSGISALATPGHTVGHTSLMVSSGPDSVVVQGDLTHVPFLFVRHPDWRVVFDQAPDQAEVSRRRIYDMLAADGIKVHGFHFPFPSVAYVEKAGTGYREVPVMWAPYVL